MNRKIINTLTLFLVAQRPDLNDLYIIKFIYDNDIQEVIDNLLIPMEENKTLDQMLIPLEQGAHPTATHAINIDGIVFYCIVNSASVIINDVCNKRITKNHAMAA